MSHDPRGAAGWRWSRSARGVKPAFLDDPRREIDVYRTVLAGTGLGTVACYGAVADESAGRYWLFLERVPGPVLAHVSDFAVWQAAARWLATLHARPVAPDARLPAHDADYYHLWPRRAAAFRPTCCSRSRRSSGRATGSSAAACTRTCRRWR